jgi:hypothetical protein
VTDDRRPDVNIRRFRAQTREGPLMMAQESLRSKVEDHLDNIRRICLDISFEDELDEAEAARAIEIQLQKIEGEIDAIRILRCGKDSAGS